MADADPHNDLQMPLPPFTRAGYRRLMATFLDAGYRPASFANVHRDRRDLVVRHDIDLSLAAAVTIAELECDMGIQATYFVMVSSSFYNIFSSESRRLITRLGELGHHVGLHFDTAIAPAFSEDLLATCDAAIAQEFRALASVVDRPVEMISLHHPRPELINRERLPGGLPHTYEPRFFSDLTYVADSGGRWRFGGPFERPAFREGTAIHLLTHPIWWAHDAPDAEPGHTLAKFAARLDERLRYDLARGFKPYRDFIADGNATG